MIIIKYIVNKLLYINGFQTFYSKIKCKKQGCIQEKKILKKGGDKDKDFYVIRRENSWGIFSIISVYVQFIRYSLDRGMIPVIDLQTVDNLYKENENENSWEYFFEQPLGYSIDDISTANKITISGDFVYFPLKERYVIDYETFQNERILRKYKDIAKKYIRFNKQTLDFIEKYKKKLFSNIESKDVISVYCRGTDYTDLKPKNHPVQPSAHDVIEKTKEIIVKYKCKYVYLVTEDQRVKEAFFNAFGEKLLCTNDQRFGAATNKEDWIWKRDICTSKKYKGLMYITNMMLLSYGNYFVGGVTGGTAGFMLMNEKHFDYQYFFNLGRY